MGQGVQPGTHGAQGVIENRFEGWKNIRQEYQKVYFLVLLLFYLNVYKSTMKISKSQMFTVRGK